MKFTQSEYNAQLSYLGGLISLGGLSECGKTTAGIYYESIGFERIKIIQIEREIMIDRGFDLSSGMTDLHFVELYKYEPEKTFKEFLFRLVEIMKAKRKKFASIESLYRASLGEFLKTELNEKVINIFIDAPIEVRAQRELVKINQHNQKNNLPIVNLEDVIVQVRRKDEFKIKHNALDCRDIADEVVLNDSSKSFDDFINELNSIVRIKFNYPLYK